MPFGVRMTMVAILMMVEAYAIFRITVSPLGERPRWRYYLVFYIVFEEKLGGDFWRCHRSYLVNRSRVSSVWLKENLVETCLLSRKAKSEYAASL